jgi:hypothetical protein
MMPAPAVAPTSVIARPSACNARRGISERMCKSTAVPVGESGRTDRFNTGRSGFAPTLAPCRANLRARSNATVGVWFERWAVRSRRGVHHRTAIHDLPCDGRRVRTVRCRTSG